MNLPSENNYTSSGELLPYPSVRPTVRSTIQARAKPCLRAGAGGVGGLVAVSVDGDFYFPGYDNNGNIIGYWNEDGLLVAEYAYDAFGNTIYEDGDLADFFPHRFSTKYYDAETDLYYYGYRYYSPSLGRWISRDPIEEEGGCNLYQCCFNDMLSNMDFLGAVLLIFDAAEYKPSSDPKNPTLESRINFGRQNALRVFRKVLMVPQKNWTKLQSEGKVEFDGKPFLGTQSEYLMIIARELCSFVIRPSSPDLQTYLNQLAQWIPVANRPYDDIVVTIHGGCYGDIPAGLVDFMGNRQLVQSDVMTQVREVFLKHPTSATKEVISCFQHYEAPLQNTPQARAQALQDSMESFDVVPPIGDANDCGIYFNPFNYTRSSPFLHR